MVSTAEVGKAHYFFVATANSAVALVFLPCVGLFASYCEGDGVPGGAVGGKYGVHTYSRVLPHPMPLFLFLLVKSQLLNSTS